MRPSQLRYLFVGLCCFGISIITLGSFFFALSKVGVVSQHCVPFSYAKPLPVPERCTMNTCWDFGRCIPSAEMPDKLNVYLYPKMFPPSMGPEHPDFITGFVPYDEIIKGIESLPWVNIVSDPNQACVLVPRIVDMQGLGLVNNVPSVNMLSELLPHWNEGRNHIVFNFTEEELPPVQVGRAVVLRSNCLYYYCRHGFDIPFPIYQRHDATAALATQDRFEGSRKYLLTFKGTRNREKVYRNRLSSIHNGKDVIILMVCFMDFWMPVVDRAQCKREESNWESFSYDDLLVNTTFALVPEGSAVSTYRLFEVMQAGAIPVLLDDAYVLPFSDLIDWRKLSLHVSIHELPRLPQLLRSIPEHRIVRMQRRVRATYARYFASLRVTAAWGLEVLRRRIPTANWDVAESDWDAAEAERSEGAWVMP